MLVRHGLGVHRIPPRVSDDGQRPSSRGETAVFMLLIWEKRKRKISDFQKLLA
jgi:hypothetical protein